MRVRVRVMMRVRASVWGRIHQPSVCIRQDQDADGDEDEDEGILSITHPSICALYDNRGTDSIFADALVPSPS